MRTLAAVALLGAAILAGCTSDDGGEPSASGALVAAFCPPAADANREAIVATLTTNYGTMKARLFGEEVPATVANFVRLAGSGYYNGTPFHRIITDFMMQGGQGATEVEKIPDEFHHALRHDRAGLLSMANAGPDTGNSQFFITFKATPWLNDRHTVFGEVFEGLEALADVNAEAASSGGTPRAQVTLEGVSIERAPLPAAAHTGVKLSSFLPTHAVSLDGGQTGFVFTAESVGDQRQAVSLEIQAPPGVRAEAECLSWSLPAGQRHAQVLRVEAPAGPAENLTVRVLATPGGEALELTVRRSPDVAGAALGAGDEVTAHYIGLSVDGRIFDTSRAAVAHEAATGGLGYDQFKERPANQYAPFPFTVGGQVIQGFSKLATGIQPGGADAGRMAGDDAYPWSQCQPNRSCLGGRVLLFDLEVLPQ